MFILGGILLLINIRVRSIAFLFLGIIFIVVDFVL